MIPHAQQMFFCHRCYAAKQHIRNRKPMQRETGTAMMPCPSERSNLMSATAKTYTTRCLMVRRVFDTVGTLIFVSSLLRFLRPFGCVASLGLRSLTGGCGAPA